MIQPNYLSNAEIFLLIIICLHSNIELSKSNIVNLYLNIESLKCIAVILYLNWQLLHFEAKLSMLIKYYYPLFMQSLHRNRIKCLSDEQWWRIIKSNRRRDVINHAADSVLRGSMKTKIYFIANLERYGAYLLRNCE